MHQALGTHVTDWNEGSWPELNVDPDPKQILRNITWALDSTLAASSHSFTRSWCTSPKTNWSCHGSKSMAYQLEIFNTLMVYTQSLHSNRSKGLLTACPLQSKHPQHRQSEFLWVPQAHDTLSTYPHRPSHQSPTPIKPSHISNQAPLYFSCIGHGK